MVEDPPIASIAHVIQLAVAPVFLLSGIGALLNVIGSRLSRIIDRARVLEGQFANATPPQADALRRSLASLARRVRLAYWSLSLCTGCAVLICADIVVLFVGTMAGVALTGVVAVVFVAAMLLLIAGLLCFLREVFVATRFLRIGEPEPERIAPRRKP